MEDKIKKLQVERDEFTSETRQETAIAAKAVMIPHIGDDGRIENPKAMIRTNNEYLKPFN